MDKEEWAFFQKEEQRRKRLLDRPLFNLGTNCEKHHDIGILNDKNAITKLHKPRHHFITQRVNVELRRYKDIHVFIRGNSIVGSLELLAFELRHALWNVKENPSLEAFQQALAERGINVSEVEHINKRILEVVHYDNITRKDIHKEENNEREQTKET